MIYPDHRRVKSRQVVHGTRRLAARLADYHGGRISFAEFDAVVQGQNHVRHADSWLAPACAGGSACNGNLEKRLGPGEIEQLGTDGMSAG